MKTTHLLAAMVVLAGFAQVGEAGLFDRVLCRKASKRCDCDCVPTCQPVCCKPIIVRPCFTSVHCYQRQCCSMKPVCCDVCCAPENCCIRCPGASCCPSDGCCDVNGGGCCDNGCCADNCCADDCCDECCPGTCCDLAQLIYEARTGCYARHRKRAIHRLSDRYDCVCHPEVMCTLIYALNDADERVRAKAADEIGDQLRRNPCCCSERVVSALTCALADCHWAVRWQAKQALKRCGYQVVKPRKIDCCELSCCETGCCEAGCCDFRDREAGGKSDGQPIPAAPADLPTEGPQSPTTAPAPQPTEAAPEPPSAYFQLPVIRQTSATTPAPAPAIENKDKRPAKSPVKRSLAALVELFD